MTGAPMPEGANAVVMVEHTEPLPPSQVRILRTVRKGKACFAAQPSFIAASASCLQARRIELADIGTLASFGKAEVQVSRKPRVAILATGDELVEVRENPSCRADSQQQQLHSLTRRLLPPERSLCCWESARDNR